MAALAGAENVRVGLRPYNVASGRPAAVGEMATALAAVVGGPEPVVTGEFPARRCAARGRLPRSGESRAGVRRADRAGRRGHRVRALGVARVTVREAGRTTPAAARLLRADLATASGALRLVALACAAGGGESKGTGDCVMRREIS